MSVPRISPKEAFDLLSKGYAYLDVRSVPEFEAGHPSGAYNVPFLNSGPNGMVPNAVFLAVVEATFAKDQKLVVSCKMGGRSAKAAKLLMEAGFAELVDQRAGFAGAVNSFGKVTEPGWQPCELPTSTTAEAGRSYSELWSDVSD